MEEDMAETHISIPNMFTLGVILVFGLALLYLLRVNILMKGVPDEVKKLSGTPWTSEQLRNAYAAIEKRSMAIDYEGRLPPKLDRRYIVTGGNGLVGGFIVLQLLARGTPPGNIRILDIRDPERRDMATGAAKEVDFIRTDITSATAVKAAFDKPWSRSVARLPLTVFHTAAVILASDRSELLYSFPEAVNVHGTMNVMEAAKNAGADVFSSTSSGSIPILPVQPFVLKAKEPKNFWQLLDERDFFRPLRPRSEFFGNYPASKAKAERLVCAENTESFRTGCIRPANGVYGNPTDNTVGGPLSQSIFPTWVPHIVQSFVHGANVAIAHLHHEFVLLDPKNQSQAGRPFVVTDPNPPIRYRDLYTAISTLSNHAFYTITVPPVPLILLSYLVEWYNLLPLRYPFLRKIIPRITGDVRHLQPGIFSICTHLIASDSDAQKPVEKGGLGYKGVITTLEGMVLEVLEWNREHAGGDGSRKPYTTSISLADQLLQLGVKGKVIAA